jgi:GNAT superfamily N-acetyltransferase
MAIEALAFRADNAVVGGFVVTIDRHVDFDYANYAFPVRACHIGIAMEQLRELFKSRSRRLRIELNEPVWPDLPGELAASGLVEVERHPLMIVSRDEFRPVRHDGVTVELLDPECRDEKISWFQGIRATGNGEEFRHATPEAIDRGRLWLRRGHVYALGYMNGEPAGTGACLPLGAVSDMVGIATLPQMRGHGVAQVVTTALLDHIFARSVDTVFLDAEDERARRLYEKLGFEVIGDRLVYEAKPACAGLAV